MELKDVIIKRQSVRKYTDQDVTPENLQMILESARIAPSGSNYQNWHFVVIRNHELKEKIGQEIVEKNEEISRKIDKKDVDKGLRFRKFAKNFTLFFLNAPVLIVVYTTTDIPSGYRECVLAGCPQEDIDELFKRNPGLQSIGAAVENMTLTAVDLGYGSCWMTGQNYAAKEIEATIKKEAGFDKEGFYMTCMLAIGVPQDGIKSPGKKELNEICTFVD